MQRETKSGESPVVFVLKEGSEIKKNLLDYSLLFLHTNCLEAFHGPSNGELQAPFFHRLQDELRGKKRGLS